MSSEAWVVVNDEDGGLSWRLGGAVGDECLGSSWRFKQSLEGDKGGKGAVAKSRADRGEFRGDGFLRDSLCSGRVVKDGEGDAGHEDSSNRPVAVLGGGDVAAPGGGVAVSRSGGGGGRDNFGAGGNPYSSTDFHPEIVVMYFIYNPLLKSGFLNYAKLICDILKVCNAYETHFLDFSVDGNSICEAFTKSHEVNVLWLTSVFKNHKFKLDTLLRQFLKDADNGLFVKPKLLFILQPDCAYLNVLVSSLIYEGKFTQEASSYMFMTCFNNDVSGLLRNFITQQYYFILEKNVIDSFAIQHLYTSFDVRLKDVLFDFVHICSVQMSAIYDTYTSDNLFSILQRVTMKLVLLLYKEKIPITSEGSLVSLFEKLAKDAIPV